MTGQKSINPLDYLSYAGIPTFWRAKHTQDLAAAELVVVGNPYDCGTSSRTGARYGPRAMREESLNIGAYGSFYPWTYKLKEEFSLIDYGDAVGDTIGLGGAEAMVKAQFEAADRILTAGASLLVLGGDHSSPHGSMPAVARHHGKLSIIHFDAHQDAVRTGKGDVHHGNFAWELVQSGVIDDSRSAQLYIRTLTDPVCAQDYSIFYTNEALEMGADALATRVRKIVGDNPVYITFDVDALDPSHAPGTGTPVFGGPSMHEVRKVIQGLAGINIVAADIVEVAPQLDAHNRLTAVAGATLAIDMLYLMAEARKKYR